MTDQPQRPDRPGNRKQRLRDAAFVLPAIGAVLILIPIMWPKPTEVETGVQTSTALIYLFAIWFGMIGLAAILAFYLRRLGDNPQ